MSPNTTRQPPTLAEFRALVATHLDVEPATIQDDTDLIEPGFDSLGMMRVVNSMS
ncbi:phosphopantetheine-binding protein [Nocardia nepalensis]|uniref:phosphopantetheine-binding protein n=1 Tax=Nocardia nepalensis TaxID=3375448 RepID=UPI003B66B912